MKPFKILKQIFQILSLVFFLGSILVCGVDVQSNAAFYLLLSGVVGLPVLGAVGVFLLSAPGDCAKRVGNGLALSSYAIGLTLALMELENSSAAVVMLVSVVFLALFYLCILILSLMGRGSADVEDPAKDIRIVRVKEWKKILDEGIISEEEFEAKRCQILGIKPVAEEKAEKSAQPAPKK